MQRWGEGTYEANPVYFHTLLRELGGHGEEISRDIDRVFESQAWVVTLRAQIAILHAHLPHHGPQPLLAGPQVRRLVLGGVEVGGEGIVELLLQRCEVRWGAVGSRFVPQGYEGLVKRSEEVDEVQEAVEVVGLGIGRVIVLGGEGDGGLEGEGTVTLKGVGPGGILARSQLVQM